MGNNKNKWWGNIQEEKEEDKTARRKYLENYFRKSPIYSQAKSIEIPGYVDPLVEEAANAYRDEPPIAVPLKSNLMASTDMAGVGEPPKRKTTQAQKYAEIVKKHVMGEDETIDTDVENARQLQREQLLAANLGEAGGRIGAAISGIKPEGEFWQNLRGQTGDELAMALKKRESQKEEKKTLEERQFKEKLLDKQIKAEKDLATLKQKEGPKLTPAQEQVDKEFAKTYEAGFLKGEGNNALKAVQDLKAAAEEVKEFQPNRGAGQAPEFIRKALTPTSRKIQTKANAAIMTSLRQLMGPQFTKEEGERVMNQTYDPTQPWQVNYERMLAKANEIENGLLQKMDAARYYEANGTVAGYNSNPMRGGQSITKGKQYDADVIAYAQKYGISEEQANNMKIKRTRQTAGGL